MKNNKTHKQSGKHLEKKNRGYTYKITCTRVVTNPGCLKKYQMNAMAMYYDPKVSYKNDLNFNVIKFMEKIINRNEKVEKLNDITTCISATKSPNMLILI